MRYNVIMAESGLLEDYARLGPEEILGIIERAGYVCDGRILALNSYENRVYQVGVEGAEPVIVKFYRPGRWTDAQIIEEHEFTLELAAGEIPVVPPLQNKAGVTLHHADNYRFAFYPRRGGRPPELDNPAHLEQLGRYLGRMHSIGAITAFRYRETLSMENFGVASVRFLLENGFIPADLERSYESLCEDLIKRVRQCFDRAGKVQHIRLHGDCHHGNILWRDDVPYIVDFDDARNGPAIQDLWMLLSGDRDYMTARLADLLEGYTMFYEFDPRELNLIEALRTLRMLHYAAWIARRWNDPAFPRAFPWFNTQHYWQDHILTLREQAAMMDEPPLNWHR